ncbi:1,2-a-D-mannosidase [Cordyceps fumosorosea ARSEF 2679]|uniref:alpha-1,2-Mannosidase n=1 Tax=Cordyceps fumosorosea (strain ARSEF 2679) TaxID=1081104 RepID=A0A167VTC9_CORFA|nr:1,2-a-D-mannosidase [Cordyceps fumosorosea ARSEF 2679]OAA62961.1 1,2-a-D-mannosidase [Cordyceps fumosorosea ARSEF 2679]
MKVKITSSVLLGLASRALALPSDPSLKVIPDSQLSERSSKVFPPVPDWRAEEVKRVFRESWLGYYRHAWGYDVLHPRRRDGEDDRNGWALTVIDALSTAIIMKDKNVTAKSVEIISTLDFGTTKKRADPISVFKATAHYLGGLVGSYGILHGNMPPVEGKDKNGKWMLDQAKTLADGLSVAFDAPTGIPDPTVYFNPAKVKSGADRSSAAEIGTLLLEWTYLSDLIGDDKYYKMAQKAENYLLRPYGAPEAWPGLIGTWVGVKDGEFKDSSGGWGSHMGSFYDYLIKMYLYDPKWFSEHKDRWVKAADSTIAYLASQPSSRSNLTFLKSYDGQSTTAESEHAAAFAGGTFILGGLALNETKYIDFGLQLTDSYYQTYKTPSGIGPEGFRWVDAQLGGSPPSDQAGFYNESGFWASSPGWGLRPEMVESLYYAYQVTRDRKYQDMAYEVFKTVRSVCWSGAGYATIKDVMAPDGGGFDDRMESSWLAKTLKFLYLIFVEEDSRHFLSKAPWMEYVFTAGGHPIRTRRH